MTHGVANGEKKDTTPSPEEERLKNELDTARADYAMVYRQIEATRKFQVGRLFLKEEEQIRKNEPLGDLARAWNAYDNALKAYLIEIRQTRGELAERRARAHEAEELIRDKRRLRFMAAFGRGLATAAQFKYLGAPIRGLVGTARWAMENPVKAAALSALIITLGAGAALAFLPASILATIGVYAGSATAGLAVGLPTLIWLRGVIEQGDKKYEEGLSNEGKLSPEEVGQKMADRRRNSKVITFLLSLFLGWNVRQVARDFLLGVDFVGVQKGFHDTMSIKTQAAEVVSPDEIRTQKIFISEQVAKWKSQGVPDAEIRARVNTIDDLFRKKVAFESRANREADWLIKEDLKLGDQKKVFVEQLQRQWHSQGIPDQEIDRRIAKIDEIFNKKEAVIDKYGSRVIDSSKRLKQLYYLIDQGRFKDCAEEIQIAEAQLSDDISSARNAIGSLAQYLDSLRRNPDQYMVEGSLDSDPRFRPVGYEPVQDSYNAARLGTGELAPNIRITSQNALEVVKSIQTFEMVEVDRRVAMIDNFMKAFMGAKPDEHSAAFAEWSQSKKVLYASLDSFGGVRKEYSTLINGIQSGRLDGARIQDVINLLQQIKAREHIGVEKMYQAFLAIAKKYPHLAGILTQYDVPNVHGEPRFMHPETDDSARAPGKFYKEPWPVQPKPVDEMSYEDADQQPEGARFGNAEATAAITDVNETMLQPALEHLSVLKATYDALLAAEPPAGSPQHAEWFALISKMKDTLNDYDDLLHRISRLESHIAELSSQNPSATKAELIEMARADYQLGNSEELEFGLDRLKGLGDAVEVKGDALIDDAKKLGITADAGGSRDGVELVAEKAVTIPSLIELTKMSASLKSYIDAQAAAFSNMADGIANILTAKSSVPIFKNMMTTEVLAFGKLAPKVQIELDRVIELVRSGRATGEEIADAYAKADAGMQELNNHAHAAAQHYNRATMEVNNSVSEARYETGSTDGGRVEELGYDTRGPQPMERSPIPRFSDPVDYQNFLNQEIGVYRNDLLALQRRLSLLYIDAPPEMRPRIAALQKVIETELRSLAALQRAFANRSIEENLQNLAKDFRNRTFNRVVDPLNREIDTMANRLQLADI